MASSTRPLRVLMLCGYLQTASAFSGRLGNLRKATKGFAELVFVDPPFVIDGTDNPDPAAPPASSLKPEDQPRGWWYMRGEAGMSDYAQFDECMVYLRDVVERQGPFDAVMGFSQGAGAAAILAAVLEKPSLHPAFATCTIPPFRFAVIVAGFFPLDPRAKVLFDEPCVTPSLFIIGKTDPIVIEERQVALAERFVDARIEFHDGGHFTPSKTPWRNFFKAYFEAFVVAEGGAKRAAAVPSPPPGSA